MHSLEVIQARDKEQVKREFLDAVARRDYPTWTAILRSNPDMRKELRELL